MKMLRVLLLAALLGGSVATTTQAQDAVSDLLGRINGLRASLGLPGYTLNGALSAAAANQAQWMATTGQISHTQADGSTPSSRAAAAGYGGSWVSENIYAGTNAGVGDAWVFWLNSPIHYRGMTNASYQEIGIASASSDWGRAYVLVFGRVGGTPIVPARPNSSGSGSSAASAPPSFVVGLDNSGNIMHEVQPEQTIGDVLLTYGYTWEDLPEFLTLNHKTDADIRRLQIGEIVLVPPYGGTYTPTPYPEGWPTNTPEPEDFVATAIAEAAAEATAAALTPTREVVPTDTPDSAGDEEPDEPQDSGPTPEIEARQSNGRIATSAAVPSFLAGGATPTPDAESVTLLEGVTLTPPPISTEGVTATEDVTQVESVTPTEGVTLTPSATLTPSPTLDDVSALETQFAPTPDAGATVVADLNAPPSQFEDVIAVTPPGESPWLFVAIMLQITIIVGAGYMYVRGGKRR
jgi:hypothetical protein